LIAVEHPLRRGVVPGEEAQRRGGAIVRIADRIHLFSYAEVQQPGRSIFGDEDIRGLQIAVENGLRVGIAHRFADGAEQPKAVQDRELTFPAVFVDPLAFHKLHHQPGRAIIQDAGVIEAGDEGVFEPGQCSYFAAKALGAQRRQAGVEQEFDGHLLAGIGALGEPDDAHPALAEDLHETVRAKFAGRGQIRVDLQNLRSDLAEVAFEERVALAVHGQHVQHRFFQAGVSAAVGFYKR